MKLVYGEVVDVKMEEGMQVGTVRVAGAKKRIVLDLLTGVERGDRVLLCDGIAIGKVDPIHDSRFTNHRDYVSGHSR